MKRIVVILFWGTLMGNITVNAQIEEIFSARDDAQTYLDYYMSPVLNGLMYNLNNGWYTTGKTHQKWGFDLTIAASVAMIPEEEKNFIFKASEYNYLSINSSNLALPTAAGGLTSTTLSASNNSNSITFDAIDGLGEEWPKDFFIPISIPTPMIQIGVGIPSKTDVKLRYFPNSTTNELEYGLLGVGIQHDLTQHFKLFEKIPRFHLSGFGAFTKMHLNYKPLNSDVSGENQRLEMKMNTYTLQLIGDINLKIVNFYAGLGYTGGTTNLDALGTYKYDFNNNGTYTSDEIFVDPMLLKFDISGLKTTAGVRFNLGPVKLFADYTLQKYASISTGLALSIR